MRASVLLATLPVARANVGRDATFAGNTTAIEVGDDLWLGSYRGDWIAIVPAP